MPSMEMAARPSKADPSRLRSLARLLLAAAAAVAAAGPHYTLAVLENGECYDF